MKVAVNGTTVLMAAAFLGDSPGSGLTGERDQPDARVPGGLGGLPSGPGALSLLGAVSRAQRQPPGACWFGRGLGAVAVPSPCWAVLCVRRVPRSRTPRVGWG